MVPLFVIGLFIIPLLLLCFPIYRAKFSEIITGKIVCLKRESTEKDNKVSYSLTTFPLFSISRPKEGTHHEMIKCPDCKEETTYEVVSLKSIKKRQLTCLILVSLSYSIGYIFLVYGIELFQRVNSHSFTSYENEQSAGLISIVTVGFGVVLLILSLSIWALEWKSKNCGAGCYLKNYKFIKKIIGREEKRDYVRGISTIITLVTHEVVYAESGNFKWRNNRLDWQLARKLQSQLQQ